MSAPESSCSGLEKSLRLNKEHSVALSWSDVRSYLPLLLSEAFVRTLNFGAGEYALRVVDHGAGKIYTAVDFASNGFSVNALIS